MQHSLFSAASALTISSAISIASAAAASLSPRVAEDGLDKRLLCVGDSYNEIFVNVGMGDPNNGAQADINSFCRSWIDIPDVTAYYETVTITTTSFPATVTVDSTTEVVFSATSTITETVFETDYALKRRSHVRKAQIQGRAAAAAAITPRVELPAKMVLKARQAASSSSRTLDVVALGAALSSACSCKSLPPLTDFLVSTVSATRTIGATDYRTVTVNSTVPGGLTTITQTLKVTSIIRPTGTDPRNYTISGTGTDGGHYTGPTHTPPNTTYPISYSTGSGGWHIPTMNSTCTPYPTSYLNVTATITAFATSTVFSTVFDTETVSVSLLEFRNRTVIVTEGSATVTAPGSTVTIPGVTETVFGGSQTITDVVTVTISGPGSTTTTTEPGTTVTITAPVSTLTLAVSTTTFTEGGVVTEPAQTETITVTVTDPEDRTGYWFKAARN